MKAILVIALCLLAVSQAAITFNKVTTCCTDGQYVKKSDSNKCTACAAWCKSCDMAQNAQDQDGTKEAGKACPCKAVGCKACTKADECDTCSDGYLKVTGAKVCSACTAASKCLTCTDAAKPAKCATCNVAYWLDAVGGTCKACMANCDKCTKADDCSKCKWKSKDAKTGDYVTYKKKTVDCDTELPKRCVGDKVAVKGACVAVTAKETNCVIYGFSDDKVATLEFAEQNDQAKAQCVQCATGWKVVNKKCVTNVTCKMTELYVKASNSCGAGQKGCAGKDGTGEKCTSCVNGYWYETNVCTACTTGYKTCSKDACLTPHIGYCAVASKKCNALANSKECGADQKVVSCIDGFVKNAGATACEACTIANCKDCTADKAKCPKANCKAGFYGAASNDKCTACTAASKCATCTEITKCATCIKDHNKVADVCVTLEGCAKYTSLKKECTECKEGYGLVVGGSACVKCAEGYKSCNINCSGRGVGVCYDALNADPKTCKCLKSKVWKLNKCVAAAAAAGDGASAGDSSASGSSGAIIMTFQIVLFALISMFLF